MKATLLLVLLLAPACRDKDKGDDINSGKADDSEDSGDTGECPVCPKRGDQELPEGGPQKPQPPAQRCGTTDR